jgi:hypothetical protein
MRNLPKVFGSIALVSTLLAGAQSAASEEINGQWVGNSGVVGGRGDDKTLLELGAPGDSRSSLRIESKIPCSLRDGTYQSAPDGTWTLSFQQANGTEACQRLARGTFTLQQNPEEARHLSFAVSYPGPDGQPNLRRGDLLRYP